MSIEKTMEKKKTESKQKTDDMRNTNSGFSERKESARGTALATPSRTGFNALINHRRHLERIDNDNARIYLKLKHK